MANPALGFPGDQSVLPGPATAQIDCHPGVLEFVRAASVDGLMRLGRGGIEVGGLLFGHNRGDSVVILAARRLECEHRFGPNFVLSDNDEMLLAQIADPENRDDETRDMELVGWYVSHCRRGYSVAESDLRICDRFFSKPGSVTLIAMPEKLGACRAGFFVREPSGDLHTDVPSTELALVPTSPSLPAPDTLRALQRSVAVVDEPIADSEDEPRDIRAVALSRLHTYLQKQEKHHRVSTWNLWVTFALLLTLILGGFFWWMRSREGGAPAPIPLRVTGSGAQIRIEWDAKLDTVQKANAGILEMREGDGSSVRVNVPLDALRTGSALYTRHSDKVEIRLRLLYSNQTAFDSVIYFINPLTAEVTRPQTPPPVTPAEDEPAPAVEETVAVPEKVEPPRAPPKPKRFEPPKVARSTPPPQQQQQIDVAPSPVEVVPSNPAPALKLPTASVPAAPPPPAPSTQAPKPQPAAKPRSGRLIWTGELAKNGLLSITPGGPSSGSMNGRVPATPVSVAVYAGELVSGGIEVYVNDPKRGDIAEPPSAKNGWQTTVFKYDPKHAPDIRTIETPSASNNWSQLVLQNGKKPVSVLVIDWAETR